MDRKSLKKVFTRQRRDAELASEIEAHLALDIDQNLARGMSQEQAQREAYLRFGSPRRLRESMWEANRLAWLENIWRDVRYAMRTLMRTPGFTITAILVMSLGIGANTALFTVVRSVLMKPLPFRDPDRLIQIYEKSPGGQRAFSYVAGGMYAAWKQQSPAVEQMAIYGTDSINLSGNGGLLPERIRYAETSWNLFETLGVQPELGRFFVEQEDRKGAAATVVLTHTLWMRRYAGDRNIVGKTVLLDSRPYTVLGVLPAWFHYPDTRTQLWASIYHEIDAGSMQSVDNHNFFVIGRLRPGATLAQALSQVDTAEKRVHMTHATPFTGTAANARSLLDGIVSDSKTPLYVLLAATSCVLLIACLNVANLLVARSASRRKESSIRAALGGSRWRLLREQVTESLVLAVIAGAVGLPLAWAGTRWLVQSRPDLARVDSVHMDAVVLIFGLALVAVSGILAGLIPALPLLRGQLLGSLQESARSNSAGLGRARLRKVLLMAEVGLTVVLLTGAGLLLKSYQHLRSSNLGCATDNVLTMRFSLPDARYDSTEKIVAFYQRLLPNLRAIPGVKAASLGTALPGQGYGGDSSFTIVENPNLDKASTLGMFRGVDPGYFQTMQIPLLRGRVFEEREQLKQARSVIISDGLARQFFPHESALGKHLQVRGFDGFPPEGFEIVGIVGDTLWSLTEPAGATMYFPIYYGAWSGASIGIRSDHDVTSLALSIQKALAQLDSDLPVADVLTMRESIGQSTIDASFTSILVLAFALIALFLAAVGLYGVLSYLATQRQGEIGIRIALGASRGIVLRHILLDGLRPAWLGLLLGLIGSAFTVQLIRSMLYGASPLDWAVFAQVALLLSLVATAACALPAWRASRLDPMQALRNE